MISLYNLYEQVSKRTDKGSKQSIVREIINSYSYIAEKSFYVGKQDGLAELDGSFISTFRKIPILTDEDGKYYCNVPSTYLLLPHAMGAKWVGFDGCDEQFWWVSNYSMYNGLKSQAMGGIKVVEPEGKRFNFPNMSQMDIFLDSETNRTIVVKLAIALDLLVGDLVDTELNISPSMATQIVDMVVAKLMPSPPQINLKQF